MPLLRCGTANSFQDLRTRKRRYRFATRTPRCKRVFQKSSQSDAVELKSVTARRRSWRAKEYNSLTQGRPMSPSTTRYYEENFGQGNIDYPAAQLYANGGNWSQDGSYSHYAIDGTLDPQISPHQM
jgi:hypothetical protein